MDSYESNGQHIIIAKPGMFVGKIESFDQGAIEPAAYLLKWMRDNCISSLNVSLEPYGNGCFQKGVIGSPICAYSADVVVKGQKYVIRQMEIPPDPMQGTIKP
jgi:hypothetical protein